MAITLEQITEEFARSNGAESINLPIDIWVEYLNLAQYALTHGAGSPHIVEAALTTPKPEAGNSEYISDAFADLCGVAPVTTQPPTPASGGQMERFRPGGKYTKHMVPDPNGDWVTLDAAQSALTAANERAERAGRNRDWWEKAANVALKDRQAAEARLAQCMEALKPFAKAASHFVVKGAKSELFLESENGRTPVQETWFRRARALLAAYNRGLEDGAKEADGWELVESSLWSPGSEMHAYHDGQEHAADGIAAAIRAKAKHGGK